MDTPPPLYGTVESTEQLTPAMVRVVLGGEGLASYTPAEATDQYVNALFIPDGAPYDVPFDPDEARAGDPAHHPRGRRYTIRAWDEARRLLTLDFVTHGDQGYAGRWAGRAEAGDRLQLLGPSGGYRPDPDADWYLMVGDESALPAIAASLEVLAAEAECVVLAVVDDGDHELDLTSPADLEVRWSHRASAPDPGALLPEAVTALEWRAGTPDVFVHGEAAEVRAVRRHLLAERGITKEAASISPYWRRGNTDEAWRQAKRAWLAEQATDV